MLKFYKSQPISTTWMYIALLFFIYLQVTFFINPHDILKNIPFADKLGHFTLIGILTFLVTQNLITGYCRLGPLILPRGSALIAVAFTFEEFTHMFIATRSFSLMDMAANFLGITVFSYLSIRVKRSECTVT